MTVTPTWLDGARRYKARRRGTAHHDGTCDALYPSASHDRDGRCLLAQGHRGTHVYRGHGPPVRKPTRLQAYQAEREERKRLARLVLRRERRERARRVL